MVKTYLSGKGVGATTTENRGKSQRERKPPDIFDESREDFDLRRKKTRAQGSKREADSSSDVSFQFRDKPSSVTAKDLAFDQLLSQPNRHAVEPCRFSPCTSSDEIAHESSSGMGGVLFKSLDEDVENSYQPVTQRKGSRWGRLSNAPKLKTAVATPKLPASTSRFPAVFSDSTLDFVASGIKDVKISPEKDQDDKEWLEMVQQAGRTRVVLEDIKNSPHGLNLLDGITETSAIETSLIKTPSDFPDRKSNVKMDHQTESPRPWKSFATSTPVFKTKGATAISTAKCASSPNLIDRGRTSLPTVQLKGGKNWRRSRVSVVPASRNFRRTTAHILRKSTDLFEEELEDDSVFLSEKKPFIPAVIKEHLDHSSSYIVSINEETEASAANVSIIAQAEKSVEEKLLLRCTTKSVVHFPDLYPPTVLKASKKIGEGSFGEVFLLSIPEEKDLPVLKVVPVDGTAFVNDQPQTKLNDMLAEIIVSTELSGLNDFHSVGHHYAPSFVKVRKCNLVQGSYPSDLLDLWDDFDSERGSENDRPDDKLFAGQETPQKFVALEFSNGGQDLEHCTLKSPVQGLSVFFQVVHAVAVAESAFSFEHRDLHWGNVLVKPCDAKEKRVFSLGEEDSQKFEVPTNGVCATIIDFSLSRLTSHTDNCVIFNNLAEDPDLFTAEGDYQFDIYRMMKEATGDDWKGFHPKTNVFWMHYLLKKLTKEVKYKSKSAASHKAAIKKMSKYEKKVLCFDSVFELMQQINEEP